LVDVLPSAVLFFKKLAMFSDRAILTDNNPYTVSAPKFIQMLLDRKGASREGPTNNKEWTNYSARYK
jgi:hypothetical protein